MKVFYIDDELQMPRHVKSDRTNRTVGGLVGAGGVPAQEHCTTDRVSFFQVCPCREVMWIRQSFAEAVRAVLP